MSHIMLWTIIVHNPVNMIHVSIVTLKSNFTIINNPVGIN